MSNNTTQFRPIIIFALVLLIVWNMPGWAQNSRKPSDKIYSSITQTIERLTKDGVTATNAKQMNIARRYNSSLIRFDGEGRVGVHLEVTDVSPSLMARLHGIGADIVMALPYSRLVAVYLPIDKIQDVAAFAEVKTIRPITGGVNNAGSVTSEGDSIHHAVDVRTDLNVKGDSVRVGVISDGCANWDSSKTTGDLPTDFDTTHFTFGGINKMGCGNEGTAMMEIVHDLAPNADIYCYGALCDPAGSAAHIDAIHRLVREKGCKVIVDDLNWWDQPMFEDGTPATQGYIAAAVQWAIDTGVTYVASAGNWANGGQTDRSHYQLMYQTVSMLTFGGAGVSWTVKNLQGPIPNFPHVDNCGGPCPPFCNPNCPPDPYHQLHDFDPGPAEDVGFKVVVPIGRCMTVILQWNDPWSAPVSDYDLYLFNANLAVQKARSDTNIVDPMERITYCNQYYPQGETLNIAINRFAGPPKLLKMFIYGCSWADQQYHTIENSIYEHDGVADEITIGAVPYNSINNIESYSSRGNFDVYFPAYQSREKPDVVAIDGGKITGAGGFGDSTGGVWRFYGTSASAPHVAAMAALLLSKCPTMTPQQVHQKFERTAVDLGAAGFDVTYGHGRIDIERAMLEVNTTAGSSGPYGMNNTTNVPMFSATPDGYAVSTIKVTGGDNQPTQVQSKASVTNGNPYTDAGVFNLGCPTVKRWYDLTKTGGVNGQFDAQITSYIDETERAAANIPDTSLQIIHWDGTSFQIVPQTHFPVRVANTWKVSATFSNASFSPFFVGSLTRGLNVITSANDSGGSNDVASVTFSVHNTGNGWDTLSLSAQDTRGWSISLSKSATSLSAGSQEAISVSVTVDPTDTVGTIDTVQFVATSLSDTSFRDSSIATTVKIETSVTQNFMIDGGWNMISLPLTTEDRRTTVLYPMAVSPSFAFTGTYTPRDTIEYGQGYWLKFDSSQSVNINGFLRRRDTIGIMEKWNMIGSISSPIAVSDIIQIPDSIITSSFFGFNGSTYFPVDSIFPGRAYWVRASSDGKLVMQKAGPVPSPSRTIRLAFDQAKFHTLAFSDASGKFRQLYLSADATHMHSELPPLPPEESFDVRFESGRYIEQYSAGHSEKTFNIVMQGITPPLSVQWIANDGIAQCKVKMGQKMQKTLSSGESAIITGVVSSLNIHMESRMSSAFIPTHFALEQNYPNPFNPSTLIRYSLPSRTHVRLSVYDLLGREVARPIDEMQEAGIREREFTANNLSSGVYLYQLITDSFRDTKRMLLTR